MNIGGKRVPRAISRALIISVLLFLNTLHIFNIIIGSDDGLQAMLHPIHYLLHGLVKLTVYGVFLWKTDAIARLIDFIGMVVQRRMTFEL